MEPEVTGRHTPGSWAKEEGSCVCLRREEGGRGPSPERAKSREGRHCDGMDSCAGGWCGGVLSPVLCTGAGKKEEEGLR